MRKLLVLPSIVLIFLLFTSAQALSHEKNGSGKKDEPSRSKKQVYATLTWDAPTTNTDGSPLTDLEGYTIYYRHPSEDEYDEGHRIRASLDDEDLSCKRIEGKKEHESRTECTYIVRRLKRGPYWFVVRAFNKAGKESGRSNEVKK